VTLPEQNQVIIAVFRAASATIRAALGYKFERNEGNMLLKRDCTKNTSVLIPAYHVQIITSFAAMYFIMPSYYRTQKERKKTCKITFDSSSEAFRDPPQPMRSAELIADFPGNK